MLLTCTAAGYGLGRAVPPAAGPLASPWADVAQCIWTLRVTEAHRISTLERWTGIKIQTSVDGLMPLASRLSRASMYLLGVWRQAPDAIQLAAGR